MNIFSYGKVYSKLLPSQIKEIGFGVKISERFLFLSKIYFFLFGYPDVASQRRFLIVTKLLKLKTGETILDAGCGNGIYLQEFGNRFSTSGLGIDVRKKRIESAKKINKYLGRSDSFLTLDLEKLNLVGKKFDKAICLEVLEHIKDDGKVFKKVSKNLKKGGLLVLSIPIKGTALSEDEEKDPNFKPEQYGHVRSGYTRKDIYVLAKEAGLKVALIKEYFFLISRYMVKIQQYLFKKDFVLLNIMLSPLLLLISSLDEIIKTYPRGYVVVLKKV